MPCPAAWAAADAPTAFDHAASSGCGRSRRWAQLVDGVGPHVAGHSVLDAQNGPPTDTVLPRRGRLAGDEDDTAIVPNHYRGIATWGLATWGLATWGLAIERGAVSDDLEAGSRLALDGNRGEVVGGNNHVGATGPQVAGWHTPLLGDVAADRKVGDADDTGERVGVAPTPTAGAGSLSQTGGSSIGPTTM